MKTQNKVVLVTGGSNGIGEETAKSLLSRGCRVYSLSRRPGNIPGIEYLSADVSDPDAVEAAVSEIISREGKIDILINNAGFGISGAMEFTENSDAKRQLEVNLFGTVNCSKAVTAHMREKGEGRIINISSVAGIFSIPFQGWYSISKSAILAFTEAYANELAPFGISVCAILPGDIKSGFTSARNKCIIGDDIYGGRISRSVAVMEKDETGGMPASVAGAFIAGVAMKRRLAPRYIIGLQYKAFGLLGRLLPYSLIRFILRLMYAQ